MASSSKPEKQLRRRPRFWIGPLVAGGCLALGYGLTQRILILQSSWSRPSLQAFKSERFPGDRLELLRGRHGVSQSSLQADVAAFEVKEAAKRKTLKATDTDQLAVNNGSDGNDLQASLIKAEPLNIAPTAPDLQPTFREAELPESFEEQESSAPLPNNVDQSLNSTSEQQGVVPADPTSTTGPVVKTTSSPNVPVAAPPNPDAQSSSTQQNDLEVQPVAVFEDATPPRVPIQGFGNEPDLPPTQNLEIAPSKPSLVP